MEGLSGEIDTLSTKIKSLVRKPIIELKITGEISEPGLVQAQISRLFDNTLRCFWKHVSAEQASGSVFIDRPLKIEEEMHRIAKEILGSEDMANFAINELLPLLSKGNTDQASQAVSENFIRFKKGVKNASIS